MIRFAGLACHDSLDRSRVGFVDRVEICERLPISNEYAAPDTKREAWPISRPTRIRLKQCGNIEKNMKPPCGVSLPFGRHGWHEMQPCRLPKNLNQNGEVRRGSAFYSAALSSTADIRNARARIRPPLWAKDGHIYALNQIR